MVRLLFALLIAGLSLHAADPSDYAFKGIRKAQTLDGTDDRFYITDGTQTGLNFSDEDFTVMAWYKGSATIAADDYIIRNRTANEGYQLIVNVSNDLAFQVRDSTSTATAISTEAVDLADHQKWTMAVGYHDHGTEVGISINAGFTDTTSKTDGVDSSTNDFVIGANNAGGNWWDGDIGPVGVWSRLLTQDEKKILYNNGLGLRYADLPGSLQQGLVSYWNMDEIEAATDSHGSNNLTVVSAPVPTYFGKKVSRSGTADFPSGASNTHPKKAHQTSFSWPSDFQRSVAAWVQLDTNTGTIAVVSHWGANANWTCRIVSSKPIFYLYGDTAGAGPYGYIVNALTPTTYTMNTNELYHIVWACDATTAYIYINGTLEASASLVAYDARTASSDLVIGDAAATSTNYELDGTIFGVGIWDKTLTGDEINYLYGRGRPRFYRDLKGTIGDTVKTDLIHWWDFEEDQNDDLDSANLTGTRVSTYDRDAFGGGYWHNPQSVYLQNFDVGADGNQSNAPDEGYADNADGTDSSGFDTWSGADIHVRPDYAGLYDGATDTLNITEGSKTGLDFTGDFSIFGFSKTDAAVATDFVENQSASGNAGYGVRFTNGTGLQMVVGNATDGSNLTATDTTITAAGTWDDAWRGWYAEHDEGSHFGVQLIDGAVNSLFTTTLANGVDDPTTTFYVGSNNGSNRWHNGKIGPLGLWSRTLTESERWILYNNGKGLQWADIPSSIQTGCVAYWNMTESSGTRSNSVAANNDLSDGTSVTLSTSDLQGGAGGAMGFYSSTDYVKISTAANIPDIQFGKEDFTIDFWVRLATITSSRYVFQSRVTNSDTLAILYDHFGGTGWNFTRRTIGTERWSIEQGASTMSANTWYHVAVVRTGDTVKIYLDGAQVATGSIAGSYNDINDSWADMWLGNYRFESAGLSAGSACYLDQFRITKGTALWNGPFTPPTRSTRRSR